MRPSRPYHALTSLHREPCGLHGLDFFVDRILAHSQERDPASYRVLVLNCGQGDLPLSLATLGFQVTGIDNSDAHILKIRELAQELGLSLDCLVDGLQAMNGMFDAIVLGQPAEHVADLEQHLGLVKEHLNPGGLLLLPVPRKLGHYPEVVDAIRRDGFWITCSANASIFFRRLFSRLHDRIKRGRRLFHVLDAFDHAFSSFWPRNWSDGWLLELRVATQGPLAVQLIPALERGGAERIVLQLAERLPKLGYPNLVIAHLQGGGLEQECRERGIPYVVLVRSGRFKRWRNFWSLRRLLADLKPAVVHTHLFGSDFWGRWAAHWAGLRTIVTTEHNVNPDLGWLRMMIMRLMRHSSTAYVAISLSVKRYLMERVGIAEDKIHLIYNGLDLSRVQVRPARLMQDVPKVIFVGRLEEQKNPEIMLRALAVIRRPWQLKVIGVGSQQAGLERLAKALKIDSRVSFLGRRTDVPELLSQSDLFLFPSRWEGFGLAVIEAASAAVPVIASDLPVLHEVLTDEQVTFVPAEDQAAWTQVIRSAMDDPAPFVTKAQKAAAADWSAYSEERMIRQYAELYGQVLTKN